MLPKSKNHCRARKVIALHKNWEAVGRLHFEERTPNMHKTSFCVWVCSMKNKLYAVWYGPLTIFVVQKLRYMCIVHLAEAIPVPVHQVHQQIVTVFNFTSASGLGPKLSGSARLKLPPQDMEVLIRLESLHVVYGTHLLTETSLFKCSHRLPQPVPWYNETNQYLQVTTADHIN